MMTRFVVVSAMAVVMLAPVHAQQSPFQKWLSEDVFWIISDQDRIQFNRLPSDEARALFIEEFWARLDPTPGTPVNEFRAEHYRRIAWANDHYSNAAWPGWKSDRGMVYIRYGAPDEQEQRAGGPGPRDVREGGGQTEFFPYERWHYKNVEGVGRDVVLEFVDKARSNEYRLTWDPSEKDALLRGGIGRTLYEQMGLSNKADRFR